MLSMRISFLAVKSVTQNIFSKELSGQSLFWMVSHLITLFPSVMLQNAFNAVFLACVAVMSFRATVFISDTLYR